VTKLLDSSAAGHDQIQPSWHGGRVGFGTGTDPLQAARGRDQQAKTAGYWSPGAAVSWSIVFVCAPLPVSRLLREHTDAVADHMANHFSRRAPHLAASSGFARC
jgi:hypothetical protein